MKNYVLLAVFFLGGSLCCCTDTGQRTRTDSPQDPILDETAADWEKAYEKVDLDQLREEYEAIQRHYIELAQPEFQRRLAIGDYEVLSNDATLRSESMDSIEVAFVEMQPKSRGGGVHKVVLSEHEFPGLYRMKAKMAWLQGRINEAE